MRPQTSLRNEVRKPHFNAATFGPFATVTSGWPVIDSRPRRNQIRNAESLSTPQADDDRLLVLRRYSIDVINDQNIDWRFGRFDPQPELLLHNGYKTSLVILETEIITILESCLVEDRPFQVAGELIREIGHGYISPLKCTAISATVGLNTWAFPVARGELQLGTRFNRNQIVNGKRSPLAVRLQMEALSK